MRELIYRDDCDLNAPSLGRDEMLWDLIYEMHMPDSEEMFNFAVAVMDKAQAVIDTAPTIISITVSDAVDYHYSKKRGEI